MQNRMLSSFDGFYRLGIKYQIQFAGDIDANCKKAYFANYPIEDNNWQKNSMKPSGFGIIELFRNNHTSGDSCYE